VKVRSWSKDEFQSFVLLASKLTFNRWGIASPGLDAVGDSYQIARFGLRRSFPQGDAVLAKMEAATAAAKKSGGLDALLATYQRQLKNLNANTP
jgi:hypothetical protein